MSDKLNENIGEGSQDKTELEIPFNEPPTVIKKENIDINKNIGSFGASENEIATEVAVEENIKEPTKKTIKINFEKFTTNKNFGNSKWGKIKTYLSNRLEKPLSYWIIWGIYLGIIVIAYTLAIAFIVVIANNLHDVSRNFNHDQNFVRTGIAGEAFSGIILSLPIIPLLFLLICWLVQINGVVKSVKFHLMLIFTLLTMLVLLMVAIVLSATYIHYSSIVTFP